MKKILAIFCFSLFSLTLSISNVSLAAHCAGGHSDVSDKVSDKSKDKSTKETKETKK